MEQRGIRDESTVCPGCAAQFAVYQEGEVVIHKVGACAGCKPDRFDAARGKADIRGLAS